MNKPQQHVPYFMMLKINPNAGHSFLCLTMTWGVPTDFLRDKTYREEINWTPVYTKV